MSGAYVSNKVVEGRSHDRSAFRRIRGGTGWIESALPDRSFTMATRAPLNMHRGPLSSWSQSWTKRILECVCVLAVMPLVIPLFLVIALAVRLTSTGPVLFLQKRMGRYGRSFTIAKFRTLVHSAE